MNKTIGKDYEERLESKKLRNLVVSQAIDILSGKTKTEKRFKQALLLKLAGTVLPRLNEHSGEDGEPIVFKMINYADSPIQVPAETLPDSSS